MTRRSAKPETENDFIAELRRPTLSKATYATVLELARYYRGETSRLTVTPSALYQETTAQRLIYHAHRLIVRDPPKAEVVAFVAQQVTAGIPSETIAQAAAASLLEGKAWYEYGAALLRNGRYPDAHEAALRAKAFFALPIVIPKVHDEDARLDLLRGQILYFLGQTENALSLIENAATYLLVVCDDRQAYVKGRTIYATLLMRMERFEEALDVLDEMAESAEAEGDDETIAHILHNTGLCAARLGDDKRAEECQSIALRLYEDRGMLGELPKVRGTLITILRRRGRIPEAISQLYMVRNDYLRLKMPLIAARYSMDIAELLIQTSRLHEAEHLCKTLLGTLRRAHLLTEARKALQFVKLCASERRLTPETIGHVREFFDALSRDDSLVFVARAS